MYPQIFNSAKSQRVLCIFVLWTCISIICSLCYMNHYRMTKQRNLRNRLINLTNFTFLINSKMVCYECKDDFLLLILVHTSLPNIKKRTAIRETWGKHSKCVKVLYLMGTSDDRNVTQDIQEESEKYQDIVQGDFMDTYRNLTYKHVMGLKWASSYCPQARYVVKADDDVMVRPDILYDLLKKDFGGGKDLIACTVKYNVPVLREKSRWSVTKEEYPEDMYPDYCLGPFIIYSADVVRRLLWESYRTPYFWVDDVHVTGVLAKKIGLEDHVDLSKIWFLRSTRVLFKKGPNRVKPFLYGPLQQKPGDIYKIWNKLNLGKNVTSEKKKPEK